MKFEKICIWLIPVLLFAVSCGERSPISGPTETSVLVESISKYKLNPENFQKQSLISQKYYDEEGNIVSHIEYDSEENLLSRVSYCYEGNSRNDTVFRYSKTGVEEIQHITITTFESNDFARIATSVVKSNAGDTTDIISFEYDNRGNVSRKVTEHLNTGETKIVSYDSEYNSNGQLISRKSYSGSEELSNQTYNYSNDQSGSITVTNSNPQGTKTIIQYTTGKSGLLQSEVHYSNTYDVIRAFSYEYTFR
jgi:hypothetical protein